MFYEWSCATPCHPMDCIFQERVLEWVTISCCSGSCWPRDRTWASHIAGRHFTLWVSREVILNHWKLSYLIQAVLGLMSRMSLCVFSGMLDAAAIQVSQGKWLLFGAIHRFQVPKHVSLQFQNRISSFLGHNVQSVYVDFSGFTLIS